MIRLIFLLGMLTTHSVQADTIVASRTIRAGEVIFADDLKETDRVIAGMITQVSMAVGKEARTNLFAGRPIRPSDLRAPAIIERNQIISLIFTGGGLKISAEGRALDRGGVGDHLRVMNLSSRSTVFGRVSAFGAVLVGQ